MLARRRLVLAKQQMDPVDDGRARHEGSAAVREASRTARERDDLQESAGECRRAAGGSDRVLVGRRLTLAVQRANGPSGTGHEERAVADDRDHPGDEVVTASHMGELVRDDTLDLLGVQAFQHHGIEQQHGVADPDHRSAADRAIDDQHARRSDSELAREVQHDGGDPWRCGACPIQHAPTEHRAPHDAQHDERHADNGPRPDDHRSHRREVEVAVSDRQRERTGSDGGGHEQGWQTEVAAREQHDRSGDEEGRGREDGARARRAQVPRGHDTQQDQRDPEREREAQRDRLEREREQQSGRHGVPQDSWALRRATASRSWSRVTSSSSSTTSAR